MTRYEEKRVFAPCMDAGIVANCHYTCNISVFNFLKRTPDDKIFDDFYGISENRPYLIKNDEKMGTLDTREYTETVFGCTTNYTTDGVINKTEDKVLSAAHILGITNSSAIDCVFDFMGSILTTSFRGICLKSATNCICRVRRNSPYSSWYPFDIQTCFYAGICSADAVKCVAHIAGSVKVTLFNGKIYPDDKATSIIFAGISDCHYSDEPLIDGSTWNVSECMAIHRYGIDVTARPTHVYNQSPISTRFYGVCDGSAQRSSIVFQRESIRIINTFYPGTATHYNLSNVMFCGISSTGSDQNKANYFDLIEITAPYVSNLFFGICPFGYVRFNEVEYQGEIDLASQRDDTYYPPEVLVYDQRTIFGCINYDIYNPNPIPGRTVSYVTSQRECRNNTVTFSLPITMGIRMYNNYNGQPEIEFGCGYNVSNSVVRIDNVIEMKAKRLIVNGFCSSKDGNNKLGIAGINNNDPLCILYTVHLMKVVDYTIRNMFYLSQPPSTRIYGPDEVGYPNTLTRTPQFNHVNFNVINTYRLVNIIPVAPVTK
jgi:hypothetical protein